MSDINQILRQRLMESALLTRKPNDRIELDDTVLLAAIYRQKPLTHSQMQSLLNSPMTLLRFKHLFNSQSTNQQSSAWNGSHGLLLAAASSDEINFLKTEDSLWYLHFLTGTQQVIRMVLKCQGDDLFIEQLIDADQAIEVLDYKNNLICRGALDEEGELEAIWPFSLSPRRYFQEIGQGIKIRPTNS